MQDDLDLVMREQVTLKFYIGYDPLPDDRFEHEIVRAASEMCGGCTTLPGTGYWCEDGDQKKVTFSSPVQSEHVFILELTTETDKTEVVYRSMRNRIAAWADHLGVETQWVHVSATRTMGLHFDAHAHMIDMPGNLYRDILSPGTRGAHG